MNKKLGGEMLWKSWKFGIFVSKLGEGATTVFCEGVWVKFGI